MVLLEFRMDNIHCHECEDHIRITLSKYFEWVDKDDLESSNESYGSRGAKFLPSSSEDGKERFKASMKIDHSQGILEIHIYGVGVLLSRSDLSILVDSIKRDLTYEGFLVKSTIFAGDDEPSNNQEVPKQKLSFLKSWPRFAERREKKQRARHLKNCEFCRSPSEESHRPIEKSIEVVVNTDAAYEAFVSVECSDFEESSEVIKTEIEAFLHSTAAGKKSFFVRIDPKERSIVFTAPSKQMIQQVMDSLKPTGMGARLIDIKPYLGQTRYKITAAIDGITCAACASTISEAAQNLSYVEEVAVNVVSKTAIFIVSDDSASIAVGLKDAVEDCGYGFEQLGHTEALDDGFLKKQSRSVVLEVDGMFCDLCLERVEKALSRFQGANLVVEEKATLEQPHLKFSYNPNVSKSITIRSIKDAIETELSSGNTTTFEVFMKKEASFGDRLKEKSKKELIGICMRLVGATLFVIPTFIFGVVGMSLVNRDNVFRIWLDEPIWSGNVSRNTWILFILSTPVYFIIDEMFHKKAFMEIRALWKRKNNWKKRLLRFGSMSLLVSLGTSVAYFASLALLVISATSKRKMGEVGYTTTYFDSVIFLTFFLLIGRLLEGFSKNKSAQAIDELSSLKKEQAFLVTKTAEGKFVNEQQIEAYMLELGDFIRVPPGTSPAEDCIVVSGKAEFDESALTGEPVPVLRGVGEQIFAGTVNAGNAAVVGKVTSLNGESLVDQIVKSVRDGQMKKAQVEKLADLLTGYFVPIVILSAIVTWVIWISLAYSGALPISYLDIDAGGWAVWSLEFATSVFVVACPCGIGLAAPTALFEGSRLAARSGILARGGGAAFQESSRVSIVCFDKTGTLTTGNKLTVSDFALHSDPRMREITLQVTKDLEGSSSHPIAKGVSEFLLQNYGAAIAKNKMTNIREIAGRGLQADVNTSEILPNTSWSDLSPESAVVGNEAFMAANGCTLSNSQECLLKRWKAQGKSVVITAVRCPTLFGNNAYSAVLLMALENAIRPEAKDVIKKLQENGIQCWMISGDNAITAKAIADKLNISNVIAEVMPEEKAAKVKWIRNTHSQNGQLPIVAMVGDGTNDGPALACADVGIALASGSDLAVTSCDFVLLRSSNPLVSLLNLLELSKAVYRRVKFNFGWALLYNMIGVPIAAGVIYPYRNSRLSPVWASAAMAASSISVVMSSFALRLFRPSEVILESSNEIGDEQTQAKEFLLE
ncbi:LAMI_0H13212g1_1 [Lachancea mirantina]|uniref:LAMI_0H13212g1_1 n=1 Tax=Lachancea mirantina TaxID=1230905 RepID=A0A1G4KHW1_9SACH|nr:LAMI_0H13212g1_1 [Lachancea mirantina]